MSTKKIHEALARFDVLSINLGGSDPEDVAAIAGALDECRAIERAAKVAVAQASTEEEFEALTDLMDSIAKDAP